MEARMTEKIKAIILQFIGGEYDALAFSYDLPREIVTNYEELEKENPTIAKNLDDAFFDICSEYEMGDDPTSMREKTKRAYEEIFE